MNDDLSAIKAEILRLTAEYSRVAHAAHSPQAAQHPAFVPGETAVPYAARVFDSDEVQAAVASTLDFWLTLGSEGQAFEQELASWLGVRHSLLTNSGSSANLLALAALTSHKLPAERRICPGDEVITAAAGFPTTVNPIVQHGAVPVFIDNDPVTSNLCVSQLEEAYVPGKTKAVMVAHTLGNPFDLASVLEFCQRHGLWLIEDNCDALGCTYSLPTARAATLGLTADSPGVAGQPGQLTRWTGTFGDLSTQSFYPPHHLTMGEGGAVNIVNRAPLKSCVESFRDWGRDCWCASGTDNTCARRFGWQLGELPDGYDHKYIYSHLGYNLKPLDPQAAIGRVQLRRLSGFIGARRSNWETLRRGLAGLDEFFEFMLPTHARQWTGDGFVWDESGCHTSCSWFGFMLRVRPQAPFKKVALSQFLDAHKIGNRMLFGGNLVRQPAWVQLKRDRPGSFRVVGNLSGADQLMNEALFIGTYPGLSEPMLAYQIEMVHKFVRQF